MLEKAKGIWNGVFWKALDWKEDKRGRLMECWRHDEYELDPLMAYISWTQPGKKRGPHEHEFQTDCFIFPGPGLFEIHIWAGENHEEKRIFKFGSDCPGLIIIPPEVVHGYKNVSMIEGLVINIPNQLYKGYNKKEPEDIIRWEDNPHFPYQF